MKLIDVNNFCLIIGVMEINGFAMKIFKEDLSPIAFSYLADLFEKLWTNSLKTTKNDNEIINSMCFFQDIMEYGNSQHFNQIYPMFIKNSLSKQTTNSDIIHNIVFAFGLIGQKVDSNAYLSLHDTLFNVININLPN